MEERPLPPAPKGLTIVLAIVFSLLGIWVVWLALRNPLLGVLYILLLAIPLAVVRFFYYRRRRCPECGHRLVLRRDPIEGPWNRYRVMLDCPHCQIAWDTGEVGNNKGYT